MWTVRWLPLLAIACALPAQVLLRDLPILARGRADRSRAAQEQALQPYWQDFALDYRTCASYLDKQFRTIAALGDNVVPLLLEKLQPLQGSTNTRILAGNCRRVLELLDPISFLDAIAELLTSGNDTARQEGLHLLGHTQNLRAEQLLIDAVDHGSQEDREIAISSLCQLKSKAAAASISPLVTSPDRNLREAVLDYLVAAAPPSSVPVVLQALASETEAKLLMSYVDYLGAAATDNDAAAKALMLLLDNDRLDYNDKKRLVQVLAKVAPKGNDATCRRLHKLLDDGDIDSLGLQSALSLRTLGDSSGLKKLKNVLSDQLKKSQLRRDSKTYERRANIYLATEEYSEASDDLEKVIEFSQSAQTTRKAQLNLARCEAHKKRWSKVLDYLQRASATLEDLAAINQEDPSFQEALQQDKIRAFREGLKMPKEKSR